MKTFNSYHFKELDSSNRAMNDYLKNNSLAEFSAFYCDYQTAGKGMSDNVWESEDGANLLCSILLYPHKLAAENQFYISKLIALAVLYSLRDLAPEYSGFTIKWPNDIYAGEKKIAGILIENSFMGNKIQYSICGIGLNLNQKVFSDRIPNPVSLFHLNAKEYNPNDVLTKIQSELCALSEKIKFKQYNEIDLQYHSNILKFNEVAEFEDNKGRFRAKIIGTNTYGFLIIQKEDDSISEYEIKTIKMILPVK